MEDCSRTELYDILASRRAEEAAGRRVQAASWLESLVGPLGISSQPSEKEFISRLRSGLILCNAINKVHPGAVPKVVENYSTVQTLTRESQPLPAYQYFENVRNFLVAVEELNLPAFEASDLEKDALEAGSAAKVVDCILSLKSYHEFKQINKGNGHYKPIRSPIVMHSASRNNSQSIALESCRHLDMSVASEKKPPADFEMHKLEDLMVKILAERMTDAKENIDDKLLTPFHVGDMDPVKLFSRIMFSCVEDKLRNKFPECSQACFRKGNCKQRSLFRMQQKELLDLKTLLMTTKKEFEELQSQFQRDLRELGIQVAEMSSAALGYHRVLQENRNLYNMVQDLKGNIRVYCRIRPAFNAEASNVIDFVGKDGSLVILNPLKPHKDGKKVFQFNRVFGPTATQGEVFKNTQPLIRSVMDGYNVCIFAYGQTGSGKTHTMSGPSSGSTKDLGINYLALNDLFQISNRRKDVMNYEIQVQMVEIYNEQVRDLLAEDSSATKLEIRSCTGDDGLSLPDAKMHSVKSTADVLNLMTLGEVNRAVSSTAINNQSSRSHSVVTVHVHGEDVLGSTLRSCLHLVDLAGSERVDKSEVTGDRLKEAQYINKSLSCLGDVITALAQRNSYVPYRNSKLTLLLQDSLGGHAKTLMFAHVSPELDSLGETVSTLKFAQRVSTVELGTARVNKESSEIMHLKEQVENLRKALESKKAIAQPSKIKEPKAMPERTPPRLRRLSIETGSNMKSGTINPEDGKGSKTLSVSTRSRRLSLEGPRCGMKANFQTKVGEDESKHPYFDIMTLQKFGQSQDAEAPSKSYGPSPKGSSTMEVYRLNAPQSPSLSYQKRMIKTVTRTSIPSLQLPTSPEALVERNEVQIVMQSELALSADPQTTNLISSANGKGSQIRKSSRTIGKLINSSEKRNQQSSKEVRPPLNGTSNNYDLTDHTKAMRRQSLTGIQTSGSDKSCRLSLGGKPIDSDDSRRNAKTPPPVHSSAKTARRWL